MTTWFISDTHFGEQPVRRQKLSGMRADELDDLIQSNWRDRVKPDDTVWHLGDIGRNWRLIDDLPGTKNLILAHAEDRKFRAAKSKVFAHIDETYELSVSGRSLFLVHDPDPFADDPRGDIIHGHHHYREPSPGRRSVCVDHIGWGPISLDELLA